MIKTFFLYSLFLFVFFCGCTSHKVDVEVQPMHITVDVNIKIDRQLEKFFGDIDKAAEEIKEIQK